MARASPELTPDAGIGRYTEGGSTPSMGNMQMGETKGMGHDMKGMGHDMKGMDPDMKGMSMDGGMR